MPYQKKKQDPHRVGRIVCYTLIIISLFTLVLVISLQLIQYGSLLPLFGIKAESQQTESIPAGEIALNHTELTLYVTTGSSLKVTPEGSAVEWSSSDESVVSVSQKGALQALKTGKAVVTAKIGGKRLECTVTVIPLPELTASENAFDGSKLQELRDLLAKNPLSISVYYRDLTTGAALEYNSGKKYQAGSVVKAPYCKWLIASGADLDEELTLESRHILEGSGNLKSQPAGTAFPVRQLIRYAIVDSDNTAYNMLAQRFGFDGFKSYAKSLGITANQSTSNLFGTMSASDAAYYFTDLYSWSQSNPEESAELIDALCNTSYRQLISAVTDAPVAHKYGYNNGTNGFHDAAIVYSDHPYVLSIFTSLDPDASGTVNYIRSVAGCANEINGMQ